MSATRRSLGVSDSGPLSIARRGRAPAVNSSICARRASAWAPPRWASSRPRRKGSRSRALVPPTQLGADVDERVDALEAGRLIVAASIRLGQKLDPFRLRAESPSTRRGRGSRSSPDPEAGLTCSSSSEGQLPGAVCSRALRWAERRIRARHAIVPGFVAPTAGLQPSAPCLKRVVEGVAGAQRGEPQLARTFSSRATCTRSPSSWRSIAGSVASPDRALEPRLLQHASRALRDSAQRLPRPPEGERIARPVRLFIASPLAEHSSPTTTSSPQPRPIEGCQLEIGPVRRNADADGVRAAEAMHARGHGPACGGPQTANRGSLLPIRRQTWTRPCSRAIANGRSARSIVRLETDQSRLPLSAVLS